MRYLSTGYISYIKNAILVFITTITQYNTLTTIYTNNNIKLYIFNVTDVTALVSLAITHFLGYII